MSITKTKTSLYIWIDTRESDLLSELQTATAYSADPPILIKKTLPIGDILITTSPPLGGELSGGTATIADYNSVILIIERKKIDDLFASIKDGRYKEQMTRLLSLSVSAALPTHNICYLFEGTMSSIRDAKKRQMFISAMTTIFFFKQMSILRTATTAESAELIVRMCEKIQKEGVVAPPQQPTTTEMEEVCIHTDEKIGEPEEKIGGGNIFPPILPLLGQSSAPPPPISIIKNKNITPNNIGEIFLSQIPSISGQTAEAIMQRFDNSFTKLVQTVATEPDSPLLNEIKLIEKNGKRRNINKKSIQNLRLFLQGK